MAEREISSVLIADLGSAHTRLVLIGLVEGHYRLIAAARARSTAEPPIGRAARGIAQAAAQLTAITGRTLLDPDGHKLLLTGEIDGQGVDVFLAMASAGRPMRVYLVGLTAELSLAAARRALAGAYATVVGLLTPDDARTDEEQINHLLTSGADLILIVGGTDNGASALVRRLVDRVQMALALVYRGSPPSVLYAGNPALRAYVREALEPHTTVFVTRNVSPAADQQQILPAQIELAFVYDEYRSKSGGGFDEIGRESEVGVVPTIQGAITTVRYWADQAKPAPGPLCVDVGSASSTIVYGLNGEPGYAIRSDLGLGHSIVESVTLIGADDIARWLPYTLSAEALRDYAHNKALRPASIPITAEELALEQALAREIVGRLLAEVRPHWQQEGTLLPAFNPIIASGAILTEAQHPGVAALLLLDALQPVGVVDLRLDPFNLVAALGITAYLKPLITVQALEDGALVSLATAFCPLGRVRAGRKAMSVRVRYGEGQLLAHTLRGGDVWAAPLLPGERADVLIRLHRGLTIDGKRRIRRKVIAGAAGILFDARGRPLVLPRPRDRAAALTTWQRAIRGQGPDTTPMPVPAAAANTA